jgi:tRNA(His) 5'-end guanylyltransferase
MPKKDSLGDRMKESYENRSKTYLTRRVPVIIRLDGKAFHTFTKNLKKPYDEIFHNSMNDTLVYLCKNIQGCKIGYTQSDEITLLLTDYDTITTSAWFEYGVQKVCSVASSMATFAFNKAFVKNSRDVLRKINNCFTCTIEEERYASALEKCIDKGAMFDARCFNIPVDEVTNCFIWRQQDATRNAIQMLGQCNFSHKELQKKSCNDIQDMLMLEKNINFNDMPTEFKRGVCCVKKQIPCTDRLIGYKTDWVIDKEIPIFTQNREYIEKYIAPSP